MFRNPFKRKVKGNPAATPASIVALVLERADEAAASLESGNVVSVTIKESELPWPPVDDLPVSMDVMLNAARHGLIPGAAHNVHGDWEFRFTKR